jgi:hypothetical protein
VPRLVKYYNQSQGGATARENPIVYNKVGDFPLVQLKRQEIKRRFTKSPTVRIPMPEPMSRDVRLAIMRGEHPKIQPVKMRPKEDDSHQIITNHDETLDESHKSVLDALEKNCRKRINHEELTMDRNQKKMCVPVVEIGETPVEIQKSVEIPKVKSKTKNNEILASLSSSHYELIPGFAAQKSPKETKVVQKPPKVDEIDALPIEPPPKKKLQLFNRPPDSNYKLNKAILRQYEPDSDDEVKIKFVKPKKLNEEVGSVYEEQKKALDKVKLARMLAALSGTLDQFVASKDQIDAKVEGALNLKYLEKIVSIF